MSQQLARSCGLGMAALSPLLEGKQTLGELPENDAHDPSGRDGASTGGHYGIVQFGSSLALFLS